MIAIIDYGMGNLRSVQKAVEQAGGEAMITQKADDILRADRIVLPGVGAMQPAMDRLTALHLIPPLQAAISGGKPFLGICLGLQLLFENSEEGGNVRGLGLLEGSVKRFKSQKVPHMGWNQLKTAKPRNPLFKGIKNRSNVYFCHSYFVKPRNPAVIAANTDYGLAFVCAIWHKNIFGVQFHPEKSQAAGLKILENFVKMDRPA